MKALVIAILIWTGFIYLLDYPTFSKEVTKAERIYPDSHDIKWHLDYKNWGDKNDRTKMERY